MDIEELRGIPSVGTEGPVSGAAGVRDAKISKTCIPSSHWQGPGLATEGSFFRPRWQRKLGAPRTNDSFDELFNRTRTTERHEQQYSNIAGEHRDQQKPDRPVDKTPNPNRSQKGRGDQGGSGPSIVPTNQGGQNPTEERTDHNRGQGLQCRICHRFGHIARFCREKGKQGLRLWEDRDKLLKPPESQKIVGLPYRSKALGNLASRNWSKNYFNADWPQNSSYQTLI